MDVGDSDLDVSLGKFPVGHPSLRSAVGLPNLKAAHYAFICSFLKVCPGESFLCKGRIASTATNSKIFSGRKQGIEIEESWHVSIPKYKEIEKELPTLCTKMSYSNDFSQNIVGQFPGHSTLVQVKSNIVHFQCNLCTSPA